jgi:hypothetical protein
LGQLRHGQLHRVVDWDPGYTFCLIDPSISRQGGHVFLLRGFEFLGPHLGAFRFVGISARRGANNHQGEQTENREEKHHSDPCREHGARLMVLDGFFVGHGQFTV